MNMQFFPNHFKPKPQIIWRIPIIMLGKENPLEISIAVPVRSHLTYCATQELCNCMYHGSGFSRLSMSTQVKIGLKGVLGQAVAVLLVEISVRSDQGDGTILC